MSKNSRQQNDLHFSSVVTVAPSDSDVFKMGKKLQSYGYHVEYRADLSALPSSGAIVLIDAVATKDLLQFENQVKAARAQSQNFRFYLCTAIDHGPSARDACAQVTDDIFFLPVDADYLLDTVFEVYPVHTSTESISIDLMTQVGILDLNTDAPIPFDVYVCLPHNNRFILYRRKGASVEPSVREKFIRFKKHTLFIKKSDLCHLYQHNADTLSQAVNDTQLTGPQKQQRVQKHLKELMGSVFCVSTANADELGQALRKADKVLGRLEDASGSKKKFAPLVQQLTPKHFTFHNHARNVASYCRLFGQACGINEPETLYMGGFLHDIGMADMPMEVLQKDPSSLDEGELAQYRLHPGNGKMALTSSGNRFPEGVMTMILHHHENPGGTGFPYGINGDKLSPLAQVCAIADEFDHLTSVRMGHPTATAEEAFQKLIEQAKNTQCYDLKMLETLMEVFSKPESDPVEIAPSESTDADVTHVSAVLNSLQQGDLKTLQELIAQNPNLDLANDKGETPFSAAVSGGNVEAVKLMMKANVDLNHQDNEGMTPVMRAIEKSQQQVTDLLLSTANTDLDAEMSDLEQFSDVIEKVQGAAKVQSEEKKNFWVKSKTDLNKIDQKGNSALILAAANGLSDVVTHLLEAGADVHLKNADGMAALDVANLKQNHEMIKLISKHISTLQDTETPIQSHEYSKSRPAKADRAAAAKSVDIKARNKKGQTLLMQLGAKGNTETLFKVLNMGAEVNAKDFNGTNALMFAVRNRHLETAKLLLERGANIKAMDGQARTPIYYAIESGSVELLRFCLENGCDIEFKARSITPLMYACGVGNRGVVEALLESGASIYTADKKGNTAISYAKSANKNEIVELLKSKGAAVLKNKAKAG
jgi:ankyrin repeat protein/response regulator RpfG family c-di-GMP phosphodiesterase